MRDEAGLARHANGKIAFRSGSSPSTLVRPQRPALTSPSQPSSAPQRPALTSPPHPSSLIPHPPLAVLFDLDGTLLNTLADMAGSMNAALRRFGFPPHAEADYRLLIGDGVEALARRALPESHREDESVWNSLVAAMREEYASRWHDNTVAYAGVPELLSELAARRLKLAVLSNKPDDFAKAQVAHFFPKVPFSAVYGVRPGVPKKPEPAPAKLIAQELEIPPERWLYLGDSNTDMLTANRAGMVACGVLWGFRSETELRDSGAAHLLAAPGELLRLL